MNTLKIKLFLPEDSSEVTIVEITQLLILLPLILPTTGYAKPGIIICSLNCLEAFTSHRF